MSVHAVAMQQPLHITVPKALTAIPRFDEPSTPHRLSALLSENRSRKYLHYQRVMCQTFCPVRCATSLHPAPSGMTKRVKSFVLNTYFGAGNPSKMKGRPAGCPPAGPLLAGPALVKPTFLAPRGAPDENR